MGGTVVRVTRALGSRNNSYNQVRVSLIQYNTEVNTPRVTVADILACPANASYASELCSNNGYDPLAAVATPSLTFPAAKPKMQDGIAEVSWSYDQQFQKRWTWGHLKSALVTVTPGVSQAFSLDGHTINIRIPAQNSGSVGMIIGDPCITVDRWCKFGGTFETKTTLWKVLNGLSKFELDYWILNGDLFYDQSGSLTKE